MAKKHVLNYNEYPTACTGVNVRIGYLTTYTSPVDL